MAEQTSFYSDSKFYPGANFPYGLARSGDFSLRQTQLLEKHGRAYQELHEQTRAPINAEEERFVQVCVGAEMPESEHEKAWVRYWQKASKRGSISPFGVASTKNIQDGLVDEPVLIDDADDL